MEISIRKLPDSSRFLPRARQRVSRYFLLTGPAACMKR